MFISSLPARLRTRNWNLSSCPHLKSQPSLDPVGQRSEIRYALEFVVRQLDAKMIFQPRQQIERLQAINPERLKEVIVRGELLSRHFKVSRGKVQYFIKCFFIYSHYHLTFR